MLIAFFSANSFAFQSQWSAFYADTINAYAYSDTTFTLGMYATSAHPAPWGCNGGGSYPSLSYTVNSIPSIPVTVLYADGTSSNTTATRNSTFTHVVSGGSSCTSTNGSGCSGSGGNGAYFNGSSGSTITLSIPKTPGKRVTDVQYTSGQILGCTAYYPGGSEPSYFLGIWNTSTSIGTYYPPAPTCSISPLTLTLPTILSTKIAATAVGSAVSGYSATGNLTASCTAIINAPKITVTATVDPTLNAGNTLGLFKNAGTATGITGQIQMTNAGSTSNLKYNTAIALTQPTAATFSIPFTANYVRTATSYVAGTVSSGNLQATITYQ